MRWKDARGTPGRAWLAHYKACSTWANRDRARSFGPGRYRMLGERAFEVSWDSGGGQLRLAANLSESAVQAMRAARRLIWGNGNGRRLDPWTATWWIA